MEKRTFKTLVKADDKLGGNEYVIGRISGIKYALCGQNIGALKQTDAGTILTARSTSELYTVFTDMVEGLYPGLCEFDYQG